MGHIHLFKKICLKMPKITEELASNIKMAFKKKKQLKFKFNNKTIQFS